MPSQVANAVAIRAPGYSLRAYASFYTGGTPILEAEIVADVDAQPAVVLFISITSGSISDVRGGMRVDLYSSAMEYKGTTRVRFGNVNTIHVLHIRESSNAKLNIAVGDLVFVYSEIRLSDKLVVANETFSPDSTPYTDQGSNPPPVACSGGHWAGPLDSGQSYATVLMTGNTSYTVDPDSGGSVTHLWTLPSGVSFAPGSANTDANPTLRVTVGQYLVYHAVTDSGNSKTTTQHVILIAHDRSAMPHRVLYTPDPATADSGFGGSIRVLSGLTTQAAIPDLCLCIIWAAERVNGNWASYRNTTPGRSHILAVLIIRRDTQEGAQDGSRNVSFEGISPLQRLKELTSYSKVMEQSATPDVWSEVKTLSVKRAIIQLIQFYTTLIEAGFDLTFDASLINYLYPAFYLQRSTFYGQAEELAQGVDARITCDRSGRFSIHTDPRFIPIADRAAITKTWTFTSADVLSFSFPREHADVVEQMKTSGITGGASNNQPLFSLYPGAAPGEGVETPTRDRLIVTDQTDLNARTGRYGAALDTVYQDASGIRWRAFPLTLTLRGSYYFFDFEKEYVNFSSNLRNLARDVDLTDFLFCVQSVSWDMDERGAPTTTVVFDVVTNALPGETFIPPQDVYIPPVITPPQPPIILGTIPGSGLGRNTANIAAFNTDNHIYYVHGWNAGAQIWTRLSLVTLGLQGDLVMFIVDARSPRYLGTGTAVNGVIVTTTHAYQILDIFGTTTLDNEYAFRYNTGLRSLQSERADNGFFVCASHQDDGKVDIDRTLDSGINWTLSEQDLGAAWVGGSGDSVYPGCYVSAQTPGKVLVSAFSTSTLGRLMVSTNDGDSFSNFDANTFYVLAGDIHIPFQNTAENIVYHGAPVSAGATDYRLAKNVSGTISLISPTVSTVTYGPAFQFGIKSCDVNMNVLQLVGADDDASPQWGVFRSVDAGASWSVLVTPDVAVDYRGGNIAGDDPNVGFLWGVDGAIAGYTNGGLTINDKRGNILTDFPSAGRFVNICGG